ncbi:MAG: twin-arginine translocation signal domain-containing protein, partial [Roseimicrobium sp.]
MNRRDFLTASGLAAISAAALTPSVATAQASSTEGAGLESALKKALESAKDAQPNAVAGAAVVTSDGALDLSPAKWLWYPGDRTLPNTFILFRRVLQLNAKPKKATGWIIGESRY